jgi:hypothetical protein
MWGLHIGFGFATRVTYGGFWVLVIVALVLGNPLFSAMLMLLYWLGRALPVWIAPLLLGADSERAAMPAESQEVYHRITAFGLMWVACVAVLFAWRQA